MQFIVVIITPFYIFCQFYDYQIFVKLDLPKTKKKQLRTYAAIKSRITASSF